MKKFFVGFMCVLFSFMLMACESETQLRVAHISDNTAPLSTTYSVKVVLDEDDRVKDKYVDLQIRADKDGQEIIFWEENHESVALNFERKDYWYDLTQLIDGAKQSKTTYKRYDDFGNRIFNFYSNNECNLVFRVVSGKIQTNKDTDEQILVLNEDISEEFEFHIKKYNEK